MSIMMNEYIAAKDLKPAVPLWFRQERYDYCERFTVRTGSKRGIFSRFSGKKKH